MGRKISGRRRLFGGLTVLLALATAWGPAAAATFEVADQIKIIGGTPGAGKVLSSDAAGLASWTTPGQGACPSDMVAVGSWCVDKFEASVWDSASCTVTQYGVNGAGNDDYPAGCSDNGTGCAAGKAGPIYACSLGPNTTKPSTYITWFQASIACANAGKELLPNAVWQMAASGTPDPGADNSVCNVNSLETPMETGQLSTCVSDFGVYDMAGNVWEWTGDWISAGGTAAYGGCTGEGCNNAPWPAGYGADGVWNLRTRAYNGSAWVNGIPSAVLRGGNWGNGADAGVFAFNAYNAPSRWSSNVGFRCGRRR